jgi:hypothetical protein
MGADLANNFVFSKFSTFSFKFAFFETELTIKNVDCIPTGFLLGHKLIPMISFVLKYFFVTNLITTKVGVLRDSHNLFSTLYRDFE